MNAHELVARISRLQLPVFARDDVSRLTGKGNDYTLLMLSRLSERGMIRRVERGKYYVPGTNIYAVASNIITPSYVSLASALRYHSLITQALVTIDIVSTRQRRRIEELEGFRLEFVATSKDRLFGYYRDRRTGAFVADIEKAIVDSLYFRKPPYQYVEEAVQNAMEGKRIDFGRLRLYSERMRSKALAARLAKLIENVNADEGATA